ncbi:hypothetical protein [Tomitella fengzijianii]|uniref:Cellulose synthase subunit n=1 Tax=Tomitella fengzijianii TaxID=2597660 RepID=A0A516X0X0_9ACTN|nr:hypothetical protein [Tomitella fengzijianii]QDQ96251.1 hypothetical protein FO059_01465 [Tomitella fengzijianii]
MTEGPDDPEPSGDPDHSDRPPEEQEPRYHAGENGRRVPRSAWLVLGVAVVVLAAFLIARPYWFGGDTDSLHVPADRHYSKSLAAMGYPDGIRLSDDTPTATFTATLPVDAGPGKTRVQLRGSTQVAENSTVFLTIAVDGTPLLRRSLPTGVNELRETISVPAGAVEDGQVRVRASVDGTLHDGICMPDHSAGMLVTLTPDTLVESALARPVRTVRDAVAVWDEDMTIVLADHGDEWRTAAMQLGVALTQQGHAVSYAGTVPRSGVGDAVIVGPPGALGRLGWNGPGAGDDAIVVGTVGDTAVVAMVAPQAGAIARLVTTPAQASADAVSSDPRAVTSTGIADLANGEVGLASLGADTTEQQIAMVRRWRVSYSTADLPGGRAPDALRVAIQLPASPPDLTWVMNIQLNGKFIDSRTLEHTADPVSIDLPVAEQRLSNSLVIEVQRDRDLAGCDVRVTGYPIQLLDTSSLVMGDSAAAGLAGVPAALASGFAVYVPDTEPEQTDALLTAAVPTLAAFTPAMYTPDVHWGAAPAPDRPFVLLGAARDVGTLAHVQDGRLVAGAGEAALDVTSFAAGVLTQCATGPAGAAGLAVQTVGEPGRLPLPDFGRECAQVAVTGGAFALDRSGAVVGTGTPRTAAPR